MNLTKGTKVKHKTKGMVGLSLESAKLNIWVCG